MLAWSTAPGYGRSQRKPEAFLLPDSGPRIYVASALLAIGIHAWLLFVWPGRLAFEPAEYGVVPGASAIEVALIAAPPAAEESPGDSQETVPPPEQSEPLEAIPEEPRPPAPVPAPDAVLEVAEQEHVRKIEPQPTPSATTATPKRKAVSALRRDPSLDSQHGGTGGSQTASATGGVMTQAAYLFNPHPPYPEPSRRAGHTGVVILRVSVSERGRVAGLRIVKSSGHALLDDRARTTVSRWTFKPARRDGRPVATQVDVPIRFRLDR